MSVEKELRLLYDYKIGDEVYDKILMREMTGEEEDILAAQGVEPNRKMDLILMNTITAIIPKDKTKASLTKEQKYLLWEKFVKKMSMIDRFNALLQLRVISLGPRYDFQVECPECGNKFMAYVDLSTLEIIKPQADIVIDVDKDNIYKYEVDGKVYEFRIMNGEISYRLSKQANNKDFLSLGLLARIKSIDGKEVELKDIKALSLRERIALRDLLNKIEGNVDDDIELTCPKCGAEFKAKLDISQPTFFYPSEIEKS